MTMPELRLSSPHPGGRASDNRMAASTGRHDHAVGSGGRWRGDGQGGIRMEERETLKSVEHDEFEYHVV